MEIIHELNDLTIDSGCLKLTNLLQNLKETIKQLVEKPDRLESIKDKVEYWTQYFAQEIEIRIESLKIKVDAFGEESNEHINRIENVLKDKQSENSVGMIHKWEHLGKSLSKFRRQSYEAIRSEHIGQIYRPTTEHIIQAVRMGIVDDFEYYLNQNKQHQQNTESITSRVETIDLDRLLLSACYHGKIDIVKILVWENANVDAVKFKGDTLEAELYTYTGEEEIDVVESDTPLIITCRSRTSFVEIVKHLVYKGANVNAKNKHGDTALIEACFSNNVEIVKFLVENKADVNAKTNYDQSTALMRACRSGKLEIVKVLIANNADINAKNESGTPPLMTATYHGHINIVKFLIENGAYVNTRNNRGQTTLMEACGAANKRIDLIKLLLDNNADINAKDNAGKTPLMFAISYNTEAVDVLKYLIDNNADVNAKDRNGDTALLNAVKLRKANVVKLLLEHNAHDNVSMMYLKHKDYSDLLG